MEKVDLEGYDLKENKKENIFACQIFLTCVRKGRCVKKIYESTVACDFLLNNFELSPYILFISCN